MIYITDQFIQVNTSSLLQLRSLKRSLQLLLGTNLVTCNAQKGVILSNERQPYQLMMINVWLLFAAMKVIYTIE